LKYYFSDKTLEVHDGIVSRLIEQRERLRGNEKCPKCGNYDLNLKILLDEIDKISKLQSKENEDGKKRMKEFDERRK
jgi:hypothetical protein